MDEKRRERVSDGGALVESFEDFRADVDEYIDHGNTVVVPLTVRGRISGTDNAVAMDETHLWAVRDGKVVEVREYPTQDAAFAYLEAHD